MMASRMETCVLVPAVEAKVMLSTAPAPHRACQLHCSSNTLRSIPHVAPPRLEVGQQVVEEPGVLLHRLQADALLGIL